MSFEDLPANWPSMPLDDPVLARDVLDLCVTHADRVQGGLAVLVLRPGLTLAQPIFVAGPMPPAGRRAALSSLFTACSRAGADTALVAGIVHERSALSDDDRALHQDAIEVCRQVELTLVSTHLVTASGIRTLPHSRVAA
ncbi:MAG: hypothetical protein WBG57_05035 [Ornithinimicrobium sp.]